MPLRRRRRHSYQPRAIALGSSPQAPFPALKGRLILPLMKKPVLRPPGKSFAGGAVPISAFCSPNFSFSAWLPLHPCCEPVTEVTAKAGVGTTAAAVDDRRLKYCFCTVRQPTLLPMKPRLYLETTVPSYLTAWPSRDLIRAGHQQTTKEWWQARRARTHLFILVNAKHRGIWRR